MNRDETKQILMRIQTTYPNWKPQGSLSLVVDVWHEYLAEFKYGDIVAAVKRFVLTDTSGFAPSVGQIINQLREMTSGEELSDLEAWGMVSRALRNGTYGANEEFAKLPPLVQKAVGTPANLRNWAMAEDGSVETVIMSQFLRTYKTVCARETKNMMLPPGLRLETMQRAMIGAKDGNEL